MGAHTHLITPTCYTQNAEFSCTRECFQCIHSYSSLVYYSEKHKLKDQYEARKYKTVHTHTRASHTVIFLSSTLVSVLKHSLWLFYPRKHTVSYLFDRAKPMCTHVVWQIIGEEFLRKIFECVLSRYLDR
jgi:hypothetical protein